MEKEFQFKCIGCQKPNRARFPGDVCLRCETKMMRAESGPALSLPPTPSRLCRHCHKPLPPSRYFTHADFHCDPELREAWNLIRMESRVQCKSVTK